MSKSYRKTIVGNKYAKFRFQTGQAIGSPDAETDRNLDKVYYDKGYVDQLVDMENPKCVIIGRTGSGKSAIIKEIVLRERKLIQISPEAMSLKFLSNSTILNYFRDLGIGLNFFYKVLWKHVFIVEIIKLYTGDKDVQRRSFFEKLYSKISTGGRSDGIMKKAINYLENWSGDFWQETEHRIKELEKELGQKLTQEFGVSFLDNKLNVGAALDKKDKEVIEIKHKAERIIQNTQADDLINIIEILSQNIFNNTQKRFFIVIDDLDKEWVSPQIVYDLIAAMIDVIKEFQSKFSGVKIIIALRENLNQLIFSGKEHRGGQREKYSPLYLSLNWNSNELQDIIDSRLQLLSNDQITIKRLFESTGKNKKSGIEYIMDRTYMRPRDIISYFNKIIEKANNKNHINISIVKNAEPIYSNERLDAIEDEWSENYGDVKKVCNCLMGINDGFNLYNFKEERFTNLLLEEKAIKGLKGELLEIIEAYKNSDFDRNSYKLFLSKFFFILFQIGVVGIKKNPNAHVLFFYSELNNVNIGDFSNDCKIYIHKALFSTLSINSKEQEIDYLD